MGEYGRGGESVPGVPAGDRHFSLLLPAKTFFYSAVNPAALWLASQKGLVLLRPQRQKATRPPRSISWPALLITLTSPCTSSGPLARMVMVAAVGAGVRSEFDMALD